MKICTKCNTEKEEIEFALKSKDKGTRRGICRCCHSNYRKQKYIENKEKELSQVKKYKLENPEKYKPEIRQQQRMNPSRLVLDDNGSIEKKHVSYSKKAGRTIEDKCPNCGHIVYKSKSEINKGVEKYCSLNCRKTSYKDMYYHYCKDVLRRTKKDNINNVSEEYLKYLLEEKQNFKCNITGLPIRLFDNNETKTLYESASLDRIDSSKGYIEGNVQWVCLGINYMKMNFSNDELLKTIELIKQV